jgi:IS5 family transposase
MSDIPAVDYEVQPLEGAEEAIAGTPRFAIHLRREAGAGQPGSSMIWPRLLGGGGARPAQRQAGAGRGEAGTLSMGMSVRTVFADRGYGNEVADGVLDRLRIRDRVVPRRGRAAPVEASAAWRRRYRWRAGAEGRISHLKRRHGLARSRLKGLAGATIWVGYGVLSHDLDRIVALS